MFNKTIFKFLKKFKYIIGTDEFSKLYFYIFLTLILTLLEIIGLSTISFILNTFISPNQTDNVIFGLSVNKIFFISILIISVKYLFHTYIYFLLQKYFFLNYEKITQKLFKKYLNQNYLFFIKRNSSILIRNLYGEIGIFISQIMQPFVTITIDIIFILGIIIFLFFFSFKITFVLIAILFFVSIFYILFSKNFTRKIGNERANQKYLLHKNIQETFIGIKEIKVYNLKSKMINLIKSNISSLANSSRNEAIIQFIPRNLIEFSIVIILIIYLFLSLGDKSSIFENIPKISIFLLAAMKLIPLVSKVSSQIQVFNFYFPTLNILYDEFNFQDYIKNEEKVIEKKINFFDKINFIKLSKIKLAYKINDISDKIVFDNASFEMNKNQITGLIGESGSGKTSLSEILLGLIEHDNHYEIETNVKVKNLSYIWGTDVAYVSQKPFIFNDTFRNNIILTNDYDKDTYEEILKITNLKNLRDSFKDLDNYLLAERGQNLSEGQIQRLAIARAIYKNPKIIVLDEITNFLDIDNIKIIHDTILNIKKDRFCILISHRKDTINLADKIYKIENLKITKQ